MENSINPQDSPEVDKDIEAILYYHSKADQCLVRWSGLSIWHTSWIPGSTIRQLPHHKLSALTNAATFHALTHHAQPSRSSAETPAPSPVSTLTDDPAEGPSSLADVSSSEPELGPVTPSNCKRFGLIPAHFQVDRVVKMNHDLISGLPTHVLVKWAGSSYSHNSWESWGHPSLGTESGRKAVKFFQWNTLDRATHYFAPHQPLSFYPSPPHRTIPRFLLNAHSVLLHHHLTGLNWLRSAWSRKRSVILADQKGLGKRAQFLMYCTALQAEAHLRGPFLIVLTASNAANWMKSCQKWAPSMFLLDYSGTKSERAQIRELEFFWPEDSQRKRHFRFNALILTARTLVKDLAILSRWRWRVLCVDDRSTATQQLFPSVSQLTANQRIVLSSPERMRPLYSLFERLNFVAPNRFPTLNVVEKQIHDPAGTSHEADAIQSYLLCRTVEPSKDLQPHQREIPVFIPLSKPQVQCYAALVRRYCLKSAAAAAQALDDAPPHESAGDVHACLSSLHAAIDHLSLLDILPSVDLLPPQPLDLLTSSSKFQFLTDLLLAIQQSCPASKVLLLGHSPMLNLFEDFFFHCGQRCDRIDIGSTLPLKREISERYQTPSSPGVFVIVDLDANFEGLTLPAVDTVITFDTINTMRPNFSQIVWKKLLVGTSIPPERAQSTILLRLVAEDTFEELLFQYLSCHPRCQGMSLDLLIQFCAEHHCERATHLNNGEPNIIQNDDLLASPTLIDPSTSGQQPLIPSSSSHPPSECLSIVPDESEAYETLRVNPDWSAAEKRECIHFLLNRTKWAFEKRAMLWCNTLVETKAKAGLDSSIISPELHFYLPSSSPQFWVELSQKFDWTDSGMPDSTMPPPEDPPVSPDLEDELFQFDEPTRHLYSTYPSGADLPLDLKHPCCQQPSSTPSSSNEPPWDSARDKLAGFCPHQRAVFHRLIMAFGFVDASWGHLADGVVRMQYPELPRKLLSVKTTEQLARYGNLIYSYLIEPKNALDHFADATPKSLLPEDVRYKMILKIFTLNLIRIKVGRSFRRGTAFYIDDRNWTELTLSWEISAWSPQDDLSLLIGIIKHGWEPGAIVQILADSKLRLTQRLVAVRPIPFTGREFYRDADVVSFLKKRIRLLCRALHIERQYLDRSKGPVAHPRSDRFAQLCSVFGQLYSQGFFAREQLAHEKFSPAQLFPMFHQIRIFHNALVRAKRGRFEMEMEF